MIAWFLFTQLLVHFARRASCASIWASYNSLCPQGCTTILSYLVFSGDNNVTDAPCTNTLLSQTYYLCIEDHCNAKIGIEYATSACQAESYDPIPASIIDNLTSTEIAEFEVLAEYNATYFTTNPLQQPVRISKALFRSSYRTISNWNHAVNTHATYGCVLIGFWIVVTVIGMTNRLMSFLTQHDHVDHKDYNRRDYTIARVTTVRDFRIWFRRVISTPATFSKNCRVQQTMCQVPPRLEFLTIAAFAMINFVFCFTGYSTFVGNLYWPEERWQLARYIADRTGVLAVANFPMLWLFAQRNNVLLWITGWSFSTYTQFHRWVARIATIQAIIHSIVWTVQEEVEYSNTAEIWAEYQWWTGVIAVICMSFMLGLSIHQIRIWAYEIFLVLHISLAVATIVGLFLHLNWFPAYRVFVWPCVAVWILDRVIRIGRVILLWTTASSITAMATYHSEGDIVILNVPVTQLVAPRAGQFYYIYLLHGVKMWESHPFTLSNWISPTERRQDEQTSSPQIAEKTCTSATIAREESADGTHPSNINAKQSLSFVIRPYDSCTARLRDHVRRNKLEKTPVRLLLEGPYGTAMHLSPYNKVIFVVGGTGITIALSYLCQLYSQPTESAQEVHVIWSIRQLGLLDAVMKQQNLALYLSHFRHGQLKLDVYNTSAGHANDSMMEQVDRAEPSQAPYTEEIISPTNPSLSIDNRKNSTIQTTAQEMQGTYPTDTGRVSIHAGRPAICTLIQSLVAPNQENVDDTLNSSTSMYRATGRTCVVACGPPGMSDETRKAVVSILGLPSKPDVKFLDEGFTW